MNDAKIIEFLNARGFAIVCGVLLAVTAWIAVYTGQLPGIETTGGMFFDVKGAFIDNAFLSMAANVAGVILIGLLLQLLNKLYNFIKSLTFIGASSFFLLELGLPLTGSVLSTGTIMCLMLVLGSLLLLGIYENKNAQRPIFLMMCVLACFAMFNWAAVVLIIAFFLGFAYMRAMNWKSFLAALIGIVTPFWIVMGLGVVSPLDFKPIEINGVWNTLEIGQVRAMVAWVVFVVVLAVVLSVINLLHIYNYRLQLRVYNAFFLLVTVLAIAGICVDYRDMIIFIPMLNLCLAVQIAHAFTIGKFSKRYVFIFLLVVAALVSYFCNLLL